MDTENRYSNKELGIEDVLAALSRGERVLLLTRHAERPHIDPEDPTFGEVLPITQAGVEMSESFGEALRGAVPAEDVQFLASPLRRTRLTAAHIAKGMELDAVWNFDSIPTDDLIGNGSYYYADAHKAWQLFRGGEFYRLSFEYCEKGTLPGFTDLATATDMLERHVLSKFTARLGIFTSHDLFIAAFLSGKHVFGGWTVENWVKFLDSAAIFISPDGQRRYALIRRPPPHPSLTTRPFARRNVLLVPRARYFIVNCLKQMLAGVKNMSPESFALLQPHLISI